MAITPYNPKVAALFVLAWVNKPKFFKCVIISLATRGDPEIHLTKLRCQILVKDMNNFDDYILKFKQIVNYSVKIRILYCLSVFLSKYVSSFGKITGVGMSYWSENR